VAAEFPELHCGDMNKRILATFLWFNVGWVLGAIGTFFLGLPEGLSIALAITIAAVVWWDPTHVLWPQGRRVVKTVPTRQVVGGRRLSAD
jgi:hypothetical protein